MDTLKSNVLTITKDEYDRYFYSLQLALDGLAELVQAASDKGRWSPDMAAYHAIESARDAFSEIHGGSESMGLISQELIDSFEKALAPFCAFVKLMSNHDMSEDPIAANAGFVGELILSTAREALSLFRARLEGGTR